ncbi:MAG: AAA family ATPase [Synechococcaceae cyanobacterium ELA263]
MAWWSPRSARCRCGAPLAAAVGPGRGGRWPDRWRRIQQPLLWCDGVHQELSRRPVACPTAQATSGAQPRWRCRSSVQPLQLRCHLLIGLPASGKTTLAKALAPLLTATGEPPALVLSTDAIRAEVFGDAAVQGPWIGASTRPGPQTHWQLHGYSRLFDLERQPEIRAGQKLRSLLHFVGKLIALGRGTGDRPRALDIH